MAAKKKKNLRCLRQIRPRSTSFFGRGQRNSDSSNNCNSNDNSKSNCNSKSKSSSNNCYNNSYRFLSLCFMSASISTAALPI